MAPSDFLEDLESCELCEHKCRVNRLAGQAGICRITTPIIASATLHPAPPESYTVFMSGCNFKCLNCQNWTISQYPDNGYRQRGYEDPHRLAKECVNELDSLSGRRIGADRIFFSGGEPTIHLPYIERVVEAARKLRPDTQVNFDTNGYMTEKSLERILAFTTSITYDLKAYDKELFLALTGASSGPVLRNAEFIGRYAKEKLWEYRVVVIPKINEHDIRALVKFIAGIDPSLPVCFLAFRPNFALESHPGADRTVMERCVAIGRNSGLENVYWSGHTGLPGEEKEVEGNIGAKYRSQGAGLAASYAFHSGCSTHPRNCSSCTSNHACRVKKYIPRRMT